MTDDTTTAAAEGPVAKPGILDIAPYVGGKSAIAGIAEPMKLSSNENALGAGEKAREAYAAAVGNIHLYPDGRAARLRAAVAGHHGLEPERLIFGNGSDEVFALLNQTYLTAGDNIVTGQYGFLAYRISAKANPAEVKLAPEPGYKARSTPCWNRSMTAPASSMSPTRPTRPAATTAARRSVACTRPCPPTCCWWSTRLMPNMWSSRTGRPPSRWPAMPPTSWSPAPSPRSTAWVVCAWLRLCPAEGGRGGRPDPPAVQRLGARARGRHGRPRRRGPPEGLARPGPDLATAPDPGHPRLRLRGHAQRRQFRAGPLPGRDAQRHGRR